MWNSSNNSVKDDHFASRDGMIFAGTHLMIDLWGSSEIDEPEHIEKTLRAAITAARATLLHIYLHRFTPSGGVTGVAILAESHMSIHTWPERNYAAIDIFMCGESLPYETIPILKKAFRPSSIQVTDHKRGVIL